MIDLRSDTVTQPSQAMREAMYRAEVGDDCYGEDPTVNRLQEIAAERMGKEAALFMPSGLMGNLALVMSFCNRGDEIILGKSSDMFLFEAGASAVLGGIHSYPLPNRTDGTLDLLDIQHAIRNYSGERGEVPRTALICLENTNMLCGGIPIKLDYTRLVRDLANRYMLPLHLDGERVFNASVALKIEVKELVKDFDSVMFGLSKGLACPIGSVICASREIISRATFQRKLLGGGMRQSGIVAAAGIVALNEMIDRLSEDHENAKILAQGLSRIPGIQIDVENIHTNIVFFDINVESLSRMEFIKRVTNLGVKILELDHRLRAVTHFGLTKNDILEALQIFEQVILTA